MTTDGNIALATDYDSVYRGKGSLKMAYDFSNATSNGIIAAEDLEIDSGMQYLHLWVKGDGSGCTLIANFENSKGEKLTATVAQNIKSQDYQHHSVSIPSGAVKFTGLTVQQGSQSKGILYFDQILCSAGSNGDSTAPTVSFQSVPSTASVNGSASIVAKVTDNNGQQNLNDSQILVTVDGKTTAFTSNKTTGNIAFTAANLKAGIHRVTVVATDDFGNIGRASASIQVGSANTAGFTDISDHWAKEYINFVAERGVVNGETLKDGSSRFFPKRNLTRAEFAVMIARYLGLDTEQEVSLPYADASSIPSWALGAVKAVYAEGIMTGSIENGRTYFHPTTNIVRQEVMTVISKALPQGYAVRNQNFSDASQISDWALPHINKLVSLNIVNGYEDGTILPRQYITRAEVAKLIYTLY